MNIQNTPPAAFTIAKTVPDQMLVFGWGNVAADADGARIEDLQGDVIPTEELEKAAYDHVLRFRSTGEKHDPALRHKGRLVESCVFTREKQAAMGIPPGILPEGWWVGYKIDDPAAWAKIKSGEYQSFSVGGKGVRTPVEKARHTARGYAELRKAAAEKSPAPLTARQPRRYNGPVAKTYAQMRKFNPYHDAQGRFSSANGAASFTIHTRDPKKQHMADAAVQREKERYQKPEVTFIPAKSKREAVAYAKDNLGFAKVSYGTKMDLETINHVNEQITKIQAAYPETKGAVQELKTSRSERALAITRTYASGKIVLEISSQAYGKGLSYIREQNQRMSESGWTPKGVREGSTIWHEYGHVLASIETKKKIGAAASEEVHGPEAIQFITSRRAHQVETKWAQDAAASLGISVSKLAEGVSRYATDGGVGELFAEAFSEVNTSSSPRLEAMAVVKASGLYRV